MKFEDKPLHERLTYIAERTVSVIGVFGAKGVNDHLLEAAERIRPHLQSEEPAPLEDIVIWEDPDDKLIYIDFGESVPDDALWWYAP